MECHIEQVLYRDQRTIKTRYIEDSVGHHHPEPCLACRSDRRQFLPNSRHQVDAPSVRGVPNSSLFSNCHNQYCSKFKRLLYQTEVRCGCEAVKFNSDKKRPRSISWFKKFPSVLLLSTYLSLIAFPLASAVPTTISSRTTAFSESGNDASISKSKMNLSSLTAPYRSAQSAYIRAKNLKTKYAETLPTDPIVTFASIPTYDWLPQVPKNSCACFQAHLNSLEFKQVIPSILSYVQIIKIPIEQLVKDFEKDKDDFWRGNFSKMRGALDNIIADLNSSITENNMTVLQVEDQVVYDHLVNLDKSGRIVRDWLIIRALVDILEYTVEVFRHFKIPY